MSYSGGNTSGVWRGFIRHRAWEEISFLLDGLIRGDGAGFREGGLLLFLFQPLFVTYPLETNQSETVIYVPAEYLTFIEVSGASVTILENPYICDNNFTALVITN